MSYLIYKNALNNLKSILIYANILIYKNIEKIAKNKKKLHLKIIF